MTAFRFVAQPDALNGRADRWRVTDLVRDEVILPEVALDQAMFSLGWLRGTYPPHGEKPVPPSISLHALVERAWSDYRVDLDQDQPLTRGLATLARESCLDVFTVDGDGVTVARVHRDDTVTVAGGNGHEGKRYPMAGMTLSRELLRLAHDEGLL